ncbi:uncharacterized protein LOC107616974, partial [Arachis ipaensis]|uniref:uncharacterized protein LOC107616974 n=1 Tax=Arachis ipaensis TaxID=130454 RepID=UPI000A2B367C
LFWNLSKAKFSSSFSPEPHSSFYLALVVHNRIILLLGDFPKDAYSKSKALHANNPHSLLLKKEHVFADTFYSTTTIFGGKTRCIEIDCGSSRDNDSASSKLSFSVDGDRVLHIKRLKWKFRGNERVERTEGAPELSRRERRSFSRKRRIQKATKVEMNKDNNGRRQREKNELATRLAKLSRSAA